jgi:ornithine cyclodeaminase
MPKIKANGIEIEYDCFGNNEAEAVLLALQTGLIAESDVRGELAQLLAMPPKISGRVSDQDITVFKSVGFAALDLIAAELVLRGNA